MGELLGADAHPQLAGRLFTVGIPVFNGKGLLRNCLDSVINSTLPRHRFEIIIADDGSSEPETLAILQEFELSLAADPGFFRVISLGANSGGAARPRNRILDEATGEYVFFIDADDTIGDEALERIAEALATTPADWVALNQVPVNGRGALCVIRHSQAEVPRTKALTTLTVHKVFRRAEIERQRLSFDEGLPSGQDVSFAFSYILNAERFLMLGGYDYYYLTQHADNPDEPAHLSRRVKTPQALIEKNERILLSMLTALRTSNVPESERRKILGQIALPRVLMRQGYLKAIVRAGPVAGTRALRRLSRLLDDPLVADLDLAGRKDLTEEHLARIAKSDWVGLAYLLGTAGPPSMSRFRLATRWIPRGRHLVDAVSDRLRRAGASRGRSGH
jgi:glycosyltransferase involved in cell wall biosynthesis